MEEFVNRELLYNCKLLFGYLWTLRDKSDTLRFFSQCDAPACAAFLCLRLLINFGVDQKEGNIHP